MQLNFNPQQNNQQFGAIHSNETVNKIIQSRIKNRAQLKELTNIVEQAKNNNAVDVNLFANPDGKTISANIYSTLGDIAFHKSKSENFFTKVFGGGIVGFIKKCSKIADEAAVKISKSNSTRDAINSIFK